jgi:hypothetical protein
MSKLGWIGGVVLLTCAAWFPVEAGDFDGSKPLLCAVIDVVECAPGGGCERLTAESIGLPQFLWINFDEKTIREKRESGEGRSTTIERIDRVDGKVILQGAEDGVEGVRDGLGWSMAISEETGKMVLTGSGDAVAYVVFGACTPQ